MRILMRILDQAFQINEAFQPVIIITLEIPLTLPQENFSLQDSDFLAAFVEANKAYDDQQKVEKK